MGCQVLFFQGKIRKMKEIISLSSPEITHSLVSVKSSFVGKLKILFISEIVLSSSQR